MLMFKSRILALSFFFFFFSFFLSFFFLKSRERERETCREKSFICWLLLKCLQQPGLGPDKAGTCNSVWISSVGTGTQALDSSPAASQAGIRRRARIWTQVLQNGTQAPQAASLGLCQKPAPNILLIQSALWQ